MYQAQCVFALQLVCLLKDFYSLFFHFGRNSILSLSAIPYFVWCLKSLTHNWTQYEYSTLRLIFVSCGKKNAFSVISEMFWILKWSRSKLIFYIFLFLYKFIDIVQYLERCTMCEKIQCCFSQKMFCTLMHILTAF